MWRWLTPKLIGLHLLASILVAGMTVMGLWQLGTYDERQASSIAERAAAPPVPLDDVLGPDDALTGDAHGRTVTVSGRYAGPQLLVTRPNAEPWLVTPLTTESSAAVLVVRGHATHRPAPPDGPVSVTGILQPTEPAGDPASADQPRVPALNIAQLVGRYDTDLYSGFVVLTEQTPAPPASLPLVEPDLDEVSTTAGLRNLMYAVQWWIFALFAVFMWWRIVREVAADRQPEEGDHDASAGGRPSHVDAVR
ncbi:MAG: hypothetical protein GEU93_05175 [Propionibacteriales bacterium]|nr:hypothetical protein [Propionibacteriales bacterium]